MLRGDWSLAGKTYLWMLPIYGLGVLLEPIHDYIRSWSWVLRGFVWLSLIWFIEFLTGGTLAVTVGTCPWDYSGKTPYSVLGLSGQTTHRPGVLGLYLKGYMTG